MASDVKLSPRRAAFVVAYIANGFNGTQAAREAGYQQTEHALAVTASRLLMNADIQAKIAELLETKASSAGVTLDWLLAEFQAIVADPSCRHADRVAALRELGKLLGFYVERSVAVAAFVRPELAGRSLAELEAIEAALWPTRAGREPLALGEDARGPLTHAPAGKGGELAVEVEGERDGWA
jgi:hypothetical protein